MSISELYARFRTSIFQFVRFGAVGLVGVVVNQAVVVALNVFFRDEFAIDRENALWQIPFTVFNVRNYHVYSVVAFLAANFVNFMLNRYWTFRTGKRAAMWHEYWPFLVVGLVAQCIGLLIMTALMNPTSPIELPSSVFDDSSGLRNKYYWANLIMIVCVTPINFVLNKVWTFRFVRNRHAHVDGLKPSKPEVV